MLLVRLEPPWRKELDEYTRKWCRAWAPVPVKRNWNATPYKDIVYIRVLQNGKTNICARRLGVHILLATVYDWFAC